MSQIMSAEGTQHRKGQLSPQPQTVFPPPLWEALQGPPFLDQQVQEQLLPCGCHPAEPCTTVMAPLVTPSHTFLQPLNIRTKLFFCCFFNYCTYPYLYLFINISCP